jgi:hypothetical protein
MIGIPEKKCPKARKKSGKKAKKPIPHLPHSWWASVYLPVGDLGYPALCPGYPKETK